MSEISSRKLQSKGPRKHEEMEEMSKVYRKKDERLHLAADKGEKR